MRLQVNYVAKWMLKTNHNYVWTTCKKLINVRTGREIKKTLKNMKAGYWIGKDFVKLEDLAGLVEVIKVSECPF